MFDSRSVRDTVNFQCLEDLRFTKIRVTFIPGSTHVRFRVRPLVVEDRREPYHIPPLMVASRTWSVKSEVKTELVNVRYNEWNPE